MTVTTTLGCYVEAFFRLIYPSSCAVCRSFLRLEENGLCQPCAGQAELKRFSLEDAVLKERFEFLDQGWTLYSYESPLPEIIFAIKFEKKRWLVRRFKEEISQFASAITAEYDYHALVPIPIDRRRLIEREFNQSELLARLISKATGLPVRNHLKKQLFTPIQSALGREERRLNIQGAFRTGSRFRAEGKSFLVVDDIFTTGATAEEAARCLLEKGAKRVDLFALARTPLKS